MKYKPRQHQQEGMDFHLQSKMMGTLLWHGMGLGKEQRLSETVYTPQGKSTMGDICAGDFVIGMDGKPKKVLAVHPQGAKEVFKITFSDGASTTCGIDHLWSVRTSRQKHRGQGFIVKNTKELIKDIETSQGFSKWEIPITEEVHFTKKDQLIPPYTMGVLIGDGCLKYSTSATNASDYIFARLTMDIIGSNDIRLYRKWHDRNNSYHIVWSRASSGGVNVFSEEIRRLKLNTTAHHKFIPENYMYSCITDRLAILNGLVDTDGYVSKDGSIQYTSASKQLVLDVIELVQSLGGTATLNHKTTNFNTDAWTSTLKIPNKFLGQVVTKPEKAKRVRELTKYTSVRFIRSIESIGHEESQCLTVEDEHYLTSDFIVTHNTLQSLWLARKQIASLREMGVPNPKFMVIIPKSAIPTWKKECADQTPDILSNMVLIPYSQLHNLLVKIKYIDVRLIIFDESHALKAPDTTRIERLADVLASMAKTNGCFQYGRVVCLSGTPMPNGAQELYTTWCLCTSPTLEEAANRLRDEGKFTQWKQTFAQKKTKQFEKYCPKAGKKVSKSGSTHDGVANEDMLNELLKEFVHFRRVSDCIDLPEVVINPIDLNLPDDKLLLDANIDEPEAYMALLERLSRAKAPYMYDWVKDFIQSTTEQLVVFSSYTNPLRELQEKFPKYVRIITGAEDGETRAKNLHDFQTGKLRILAMSFKCGSEALNLQNACHTLYHGYPWTSAALEQAKARTARSGQKRTTFHHFLTSGYNDVRILNIVNRKAKATTTVEDLLLENKSVNKINNILDSII